MRFILALLIFIYACSPEMDRRSIDIASLVLPDNQKTSQTIQCGLLENQTIRGLESLIPKFISELKTSVSLDSAFIYFDQTQIGNFFLEFTNKNMDKALDEKLLSNEFIQKQCIDTLNKATNYSLINNLLPELNVPYLVERSLCEFQEEKGYVDLMLAVNRLIDSGLLENKAISSNLRQPTNNVSFEWSNWFTNKTDLKTFKEAFISNTLGKEIQQEFRTAATCLGSQKFQAYRLI